MNLTWNAIYFLQMLDVTMQINVPYSYVKQVFQIYMYMRTFLYIVICKQNEKGKTAMYVQSKAFIWNDERTVKDY